MNDLPPKILVFALSRAGCLPYAQEMIRQLKSTRHCVFVSAFSEVPWGADDIRIPTFRSQLEFFYRTLLSLPHWLWQLQRKKLFRPGVVAYFPVFHHWNLFLLLLCRWQGVRTVLTVHNGRLHPGEGGRLNQYWHQWCIRAADELIFLTAYVQNQVKTRGLIRGKTHFISHGLLPLPGLQTGNRVLPSAPRLLFLGRLEPYKGLELLLKAMEAIPSDSYERLTVAGKARSHPAGLPASVHPQVRVINCRLTEEEMAVLLNEHDILVLPYTEASQSGILTLGIRAAIPMICTRVGGLPEQLSDEEAVFVSPTIEGIQKGILRLIKDPSLYQRLHHNLTVKRADSGWETAGRHLREILGSDPAP